MEFTIPLPQPGPDGITRVSIPLRVKVFVVWVSAAVEVWWGRGKFGVRAPGGVQLDGERFRAQA